MCAKKISCQKMLFQLAYFLILLLSSTKCERILGLFPLAGVSHNILAAKLMKGLAEAGHDVTMVSPYALKGLPKNGSYTDIVLDGIAEQYQRRLEQFSLFTNDNSGPIKQTIEFSDRFLRITNETMHHPKMKKLVDSKPHFDVMIMEIFSNEALNVYSYIFKCPLILLSSVGPNAWTNSAVGNPQPVSYVPDLFLGDFSKDLTFLNRAKNLMFYVMGFVIRSLYSFPNQEKIMLETFPSAPTLHELYTNVSLVLLNSHPSLYPALPLVPNMVEIGGYFIDPPKKLPSDLQKYLDNAPEGVIYFSMGSNLKSKDITDEKKAAILNVFGKLKQKVIWKFEEDLLGKPKNVDIRKWCPQQDILAHPNVKLFITHGGLLSQTETIYHGVPILALPVFGDQPANADRAVANGYGLKLPYNDPDFNEENFGSLVQELLTNPKYGRMAKEKSRLFHDRPMKPLETAVYWVEYVMRHRGAPHLRVAGSRLSWYQYYMVDVIGTLVFILVIFVYSLKIVLGLILNQKCFKTSKKQKRN